MATLSPGLYLSSGLVIRTLSTPSFTPTNVNVILFWFVSIVLIQVTKYTVNPSYASGLARIVSTSLTAFMVSLLGGSQCSEVVFQRPMNNKMPRAMMPIILLRKRLLSFLISMKGLRIHLSTCRL